MPKILPNDQGYQGIYRKAGIRNQGISRNSILTPFFQKMTRGSELQRIRKAEIHPSPHLHGQAVSHMSPTTSPPQMLQVTYFPHPPHQFDSGYPGKPAGTAHCPAPRQCQYRCWSGTWWPGSGGRQRWKCPRC